MCVLETDVSQDPQAPKLQNLIPRVSQVLQNIFCSDTWSKVLGLKGTLAQPVEIDVAILGTSVIPLCTTIIEHLIPTILSILWHAINPQTQAHLREKVGGDHKLTESFCYPDTIRYKIKIVHIQAIIENKHISSCAFELTKTHICSMCSAIQVLII